MSNIHANKLRRRPSWWLIDDTECCANVRACQQPQAAPWRPCLPWRTAMSRGLEEDVVDLTVAVGRAREDVASAAQATRGWPARATRDMKGWRPWGGGNARACTAIDAPCYRLRAMSDRCYRLRAMGNPCMHCDRRYPLLSAHRCHPLLSVRSFEPAHRAPRPRSEAAPSRSH